jgi:putative transposase
MVGAKAEVPWLAAAPSTPLCESVLDLAVAYKNFWASCTGKRKGPKVRAPRFKSKRDSRQAARFTRQGFRCHESTLQLQKIGKVPIEWSRDLPAEPSSCTVIRDASGRYFASFVVKVEGAATCDLHPEDGRCVGIDLGLASLATTSDGEKVPFSKHFDAVRKRLRRLQRSLSRRDKDCGRTNKVTGRNQRGSHRYHAIQREVARLYARVADQRTNGLHQLTSRLVRDHDFIAIEDLNVSAMLKAPKPVLDEAMNRWLPNGRASKRSLARGISDAGWATFRTMLEQKAERAGKRVVAVNPAYTSQRCNHCGHTEAANRPKQDTFRCQGCGHTEHADVNAARNILEAGLALSGRGASHNSLLARTRGVAIERSEASTHLKVMAHAA